MFTRFRRSYVNHTAIVLMNHCQSCTTFLFDVRCSKLPLLFFSLFETVFFFMMHLLNPFLLSKLVARMLLTPAWVDRRKDVKWLCINMSKLTLGVTHSISCRTTFSSNLHLVAEETLKYLPTFYNISITIFPLHV